jgi:hypothetical protein
LCGLCDFAIDAIDDEPHQHYSCLPGLRTMVGFQSGVLPQIRKRQRIARTPRRYHVTEFLMGEMGDDGLQSARDKA